MRHLNVALAALVLAAAPALAGDGFVERGVSRPGATYATLHLPTASPEACRAACGDDQACAAWTYVKPGMSGPNALCELKSAIPAGRASPCCDSGVAPKFEPGGAQHPLAVRAEPSQRTSSLHPAPPMSALIAPPPSAVTPARVEVAAPPSPEIELLGGPANPGAPQPTARPGVWSVAPDELRWDRGPRPLPENERPDGRVETQASLTPRAVPVAPPPAPVAPVAPVAAAAASIAPAAAAPAPSAGYSATPSAKGWTVTTADAAPPELLDGAIEPAATDVIAPGVDTRPIAPPPAPVQPQITFKTETVTMPAERGVPWYERKPATSADGRVATPPRGSNGVPLYSVTKEYEPVTTPAPTTGDEVE